MKTLSCDHKTTQQPISRSKIMFRGGRSFIPTIRMKLHPGMKISIKSTPMTEVINIDRKLLLQKFITYQTFKLNLD